MTDHGGEMTRPQARSAGSLVVAACAASVVVVLVANAGHRGLTPPGSALRAAVEAASSVIGLLAAYLVLGRRPDARGLGDAVLAGGLLVTALNNLCFGAVPAAVSHVIPPAANWAAAGGRVVGGIALAVAATLALHERLSAARARDVTVVAALASTTLLGAGGLLLENAHAAAAWPTDAANALSAALFVVAMVGFGRRNRRERDEFFAWLAIACGFGVLSRVASAINDVTGVPATTADLLRLAFFLALLLGALREIANYQAALPARAALDERRRIARELHDGLIQELAFLRTRTRMLAKITPATPDADALSRAAERALGEARDVLGALTRPVGEPPALAVERAAEDVANRAGVRVRVDAEDVAVGDEDLHALVRVVREATVNAVRHGNASEVRIALARNGDLRLAVSDDGRGFDPDAANGSGFGLVSMRERIEQRGGELRIHSTPSEGTSVEVRLP